MTDPFRLVVLGASGGTGRLVVTRALERGDHVTAVARHLQVLRADRPHLTLRPADVRSEADLTGIVAGHDAAISVIGGTARHPDRIYSEGTQAIVDALEQADVRRFVCVSSGGVQPRDPGLPLWYRLAIPLFMRDLYTDMAVMEDIVRNSRLDWTLVRAAYLTDKPVPATYRLEDGRNPRGGWRLARRDLATFLLETAHSDNWMRATPTLAR